PRVPSTDAPFPYTTLFRSPRAAGLARSARAHDHGGDHGAAGLRRRTRARHGHGGTAVRGGHPRSERAVLLRARDGRGGRGGGWGDRKSTRLNSSHVKISYA